jgi:hypothetical protein
VKTDARAVDVQRADETAATAEAAQRKAEEAAKLKARGAIRIPNDYASMKWDKLRALASELADEPVRSRDDALAAIGAELARRSAG